MIDHSPYANSLVTQVIMSELEKIKTGNNKKKCVLILDDLDRVDPAHIFRLFNVFAAHLDSSKKQPNVLGFDIVILVCDVHNIKQIFKTLYGVDSDFNGYMDKFYSREVFFFDNKNALKDIAYVSFRNIKFPNGDDKISEIRPTMFSQSSAAYRLFKGFIDFGMINLRSLVRRYECPIELPGNAHVVMYERTTSIYNPPFLAQFYLLSELVGGIETLKEFTHRLPDRALQNVI